MTQHHIMICRESFQVVFYCVRLLHHIFTSDHAGSCAHLGEGHNLHFAVFCESDSTPVIVQLILSSACFITCIDVYFHVGIEHLVAD